MCNFPRSLFVTPQLIGYNNTVYTFVYNFHKTDIKSGMSDHVQKGKSEHQRLWIVVKITDDMQNLTIGRYNKFAQISYSHIPL